VLDEPPAEDDDADPALVPAEVAVLVELGVLDFADDADCAVAWFSTPEMKPTVSAPAAAAAAVPAIAAVFRRDRPFMTTTIRSPGSGRPHRNVKACSSPGRSRLRARAAPG
jgi:hypothetical protein